MLKPSDIEKVDLKKGLGYKRSEVDEYIKELKEAYETLFNENRDLKEKLTVLNDGLQYYKSIEKTLQKALVLAQKTSDDNHAESMKRARTIEVEARVKADKIVNDAKKELNDLKSRSSELIMKFNSYKSQIKALAQSQLELLDNENYNLTLPELSEEGIDIDSKSLKLTPDATSKLMPYVEQKTSPSKEFSTQESTEGGSIGGEQFVEVEETIRLKED